MTTFREQAVDAPKPSVSTTSGIQTTGNAEIDHRTHSMVYLTGGYARAAYVAHTTPKRLVLFVHGFWGKALGSWSGVCDFDPTDDFWRYADLLFFEYDSFRESIKGVSDRLRRRVHEFYPTPNPDLARNEYGELRGIDGPDYEDLYLVGHSLGGLVARKAVLDDLIEWEHIDPGTGQTRPPSLDASLRLFSPASAGFRPAGALGSLRQMGFWEVLEMWLRRSAAFSDLQPGSEILRTTRQRTESRAGSANADALRARVLWANPEDVVIPETYDSDVYSQSVDGPDHRTVCKPHSMYTQPWAFISQGHI